ncbi:MAG: hypothetical protein GY940_48235, partial [bacterium]|nr:hypothetical protein [bacterium]
DYFYERDMVSLQVRFYDGNRLTLHAKDHFIRTSKTKRNPRGKIKTKNKFKKKVEFTLQLKVNNRKYTCRPIPPEAQQAHNSRVEEHVINKEKIQLSQSKKGDVSLMTYMIKQKGLSKNDKALGCEPAVVPHQIIKLYSLLTPVGPGTDSSSGMERR